MSDEQFISRYQIPDLSALAPASLKEKILVAMAAEEAEWEKVATNQSPATIANTLEAIDLAGRELYPLLAVFYTMTSSVGGEEWDAAEAELAPLLSEHAEKFRLDQRIYRRVLGVDLSLADPESKYFAKTLLRDFELAGVNQPAPVRAEIAAKSKRLSELETEFSQRVVAGMKAGAESVPGLDRETLENTSAQAFAATIEDPSLREAIFQASISRGTGVDPASDTRATITEIARVRAERAALLERPFHAQIAAAQGMAKDSEAVRELLTTVGTAARAGLQREAAQLRKIAPDLRASDWLYYEAKARKDALGFDDQVLKPYLQLENVIEKGVFYAANQLFGITFEERELDCGYVPTMRAWEVIDADGTPLGVFWADYYTRAGKAGGAWMHNLIDQSHLSGAKPVICNNLNIVPPAPGEPTLLTWDQVTTCFHEFGHALHGLFSDCRYERTSGANVPRDYVEYPSQLNEMWAFHPQVIANYARHYQTGEVLPAELQKQLADSATFGQGYATFEYVAAAYLDQAWHRLSADQVPTAAEALDFEKRALEEAGLYDELVPPRYRSTYFEHTFGGGYDAGYYAYLWAEVLVADTEEWFRAQPNGGLNREAGQKYREEILSRGESRDPMESYVALTGHKPDPAALLRRRGLA